MCFWSAKRTVHAHAWTLIELLISIGIIALLASLALPVLARSKSRAQSIVCLNHLKEWSLGVQLYAADNDDLLVAEGDPSPNPGRLKSGWYVLLPPLLSIFPAYDESPWRTNASAPLPASPWLCPRNTNRSNGLNLFHYCVNEHADGSGSSDRPLRLGSVSRPSAVVWMFDNGRRAAVAQQNNVHTNCHQGGANFAFLDGHVARFQSREYWDFRSNSGRTNNPSLLWRHLDVE